jgi:hypothetical protein
MRGKTWCCAMALAILAGSVFLAWPALPAKAGGCYSGVAHSYGYASYPSYSYPASYVYYSPPVYTPKYEVVETIVPKAVRAYVSSDYFSSSADYYRDRLLVDAVAGKTQDTQKLQQEVAELKAQLKQQPVVQQPPPYYPPQQQYAPPQQGYAPQGGTPCDWRAQQAAQQAYQQGYQQAQAALQQQGGGYPPQGQGYAPPQGQGYTQPAPQQQPAPQPQTGPPSAPPAQPPPPASSPGYGGGGRGTPPESNGAPTSPGPGRGNDAPPSLPPPGGGGRPPEAEARTDHGGVPDGLQAVVNEACIRCHGPKNEEMGAGFDLSNLAAVPAEGRMESYAQVLAGAMPHKSAKLPREKARLFREWFRAATQTRKVAAVR